MKSKLISAFGLGSMFMTSCTNPAPLVDHGSTPPRVGHGNAELNGPSADDVISNATEQWREERWFEPRGWRW